MIAILEAHRAGLLERKWVARNALAGIVVGIVALPLAMAFAIASGAKPEQGLYTAIIAGLIVTLFGGSRVQIAGPTGAFIVILSAITAQHGIDGLQIATLMAGFILVGLGLAGLGNIIRYVPDPVVIGFTAGIAVIIFVEQWNSFFGLGLNLAGAHFHEKLLALAEALPRAHPATAALSALGLVIVIVAPRFVERIPAPLIAMLVVTLLQALFKFDGVATIGTVFGGIPQALPRLQWPDITFTRLVELTGPAITIAMLGAIESLLCAVVADGMAGTRHDSNQELIGQGIANAIVPLFGGFAATGGIARTAINVRTGANSPIAGIFHAATLLVAMLIFAPLASHVPLGVLASILFVVAYRMSEARHFIDMARSAPRTDVAVLLITFALTVFADLVLAVNVGVMLAALLFMHRMSEVVHLQDWTEEALAKELPDVRNFTLPRGVMVYSINGPFFFGAAETFERTIANLHLDVATLIIRLGKVPFIDATGLETLREIIVNLKRRGTRVILCEASSQLAEQLEPVRSLATHVFPDLASAVRAVSAPAS